MGVKFLSEEWSDAFTAALATHEGFQGAIGSTKLGVQFVVTDGADGDVPYYLDIADGSAKIALGEMEGPEVTIASDYETAAGISQGDLNTQTAFMTGKIKVTGNLAVLMMHQNIVSNWTAAAQTFDIAY